MAPSPVIASATAASGPSELGEPVRSDLRVVALGGGGALASVLQGLRAELFASRPWDPERDRARLTAIAAVADDGDGSATLRATSLLPAPGDVGGRVLPSTPQNVTLHAELADGTVIEGKSRIAGARSPIHRLRLHPGDAPALPEALDALERADLVVIGPGSLYSSLVAALLVRDLPEAIARSRARVALVMNLMTEPGETDHHTGVDHLMAIRRHAPTIAIHDVLVNAAPIAPESLARYAAQGATPVPADQALLKALGHAVVEGDWLATGEGVRHDPEKLARALLARTR